MIRKEECMTIVATSEALCKVKIVGKNIETDT